MKHLNILLILVSVFIFQKVTEAATDLQKWSEGLNGSRLSAYSGSVISSNSSLTIINFCGNGRYSYHKDAGWMVDGQASGASKSQIKGTWKVLQQGKQFFLSYVTDGGESGQFLLFLHRNGRVNIGGMSYAVEPTNARC
jgi:hypothetical protein